MACVQDNYLSAELEALEKKALENCRDGGELYGGSRGYFASDFL